MRYELIDTRNGAILATFDKRDAALKAAKDHADDVTVIKDDGKGKRVEDK